MLPGLGPREDALAAIQEAVSIYRELAAARPEAFRPDLARALTNLSLWLAGLGRGEDALAAGEEAVSIYRDLAAARPEAFRPDLARALTNLSLWLAGLGRGEDALAAIQEAVSIYRALAAARPEAFRPGLAVALTNLSLWLAGLGRGEDALVASQEATDTYRELAGWWAAVHQNELEQSFLVVATLAHGEDLDDTFPGSLSSDNGPLSDLPARNQLRRADRSGDAGLPPGVAGPGHRVSGRPGRSGLLRAPQKPHKPATR